MVCRLELH